MKQIPLRLFQQKATQYLDDLPVALTRYGRVVCYIYPDKAKDEPITKSKPPKEAPSENKIEMCKCGDNMKGLCPKRKCAGFK